MRQAEDPPPPGGGARWERRYSTRSGEPVRSAYGPDDLDGDAGERLGEPGAFPYTRGVYPDMYRGRSWTMRQFAGYGTPAETNDRYRLLLERGQTGLSVAFDMPTLMGLDSDDPASLGEVGRCGVAVDSLDDFATLFDGIPLGDVTTSMTISGPAPVAFAFFLAEAERQGVAWDVLSGTLQTDIFKEYIAQKEWLFPPRPHLRLIADLMAFCAEHMPRFHPISVSGYHIREAGATAAQELAFTLADGFAYVELGRDRGLDVDAFAPGLSFFFDAHIDLLRGDRQAPGGAKDLGPVAARSLRRAQRAVDAAEVPHADRRRLADGPAAAEQRGADGDRGDGGRAVGVRNRSTRTHWTRSSRCRPRRPPRLPSARSRSSPTRRASPTWPTRSAARTWWRR